MSASSSAINNLPTAVLKIGCLQCGEHTAVGHTPGRAAPSITLHITARTTSALLPYITRPFVYLYARMFL